MAMAIDNRQVRRPGFIPPAAMARIAERARLFRAAQRHSLLVRLLRVLLPIAVVCVSGGYVAVVAIHSALTPKIKMENITITADDFTMHEPSYSDSTNEGRYEVRAKRAIVSFGQKKDTPVKLIGVSGELTKKSGEVTRLKAKNGLFDNTRGYLELLDGIEIGTSGGVTAHLTRAMIYSKEGKIISNDPVSADMPTGAVQAGSLAMNTKTKLAQFRGGVTVRLVPQQGQTLAAGKDARQPVDIRAEELDIDDAGKTAEFRGKVVATQGETVLHAPSLKIKYEGKAASALAAATGTAPGTADGAQEAAADGSSKAAGKEGGTRVTFLWARGGVEITAGSDRKITSDLADFDVTAETALFDGNVVALQEKNLLKGGRLSIDKKSGKTRLETPGGGRIVTSFVPPAGAAAKPAKRPNPVEAAESSLIGGFKADRNAPMSVEATTLELLETANKAIFTGNVRARQGEMTLRTSELTAFFSGKAGLGLTDAGATPAVPPSTPKGKAGAKAEKTEVTRMEARHEVLVDSGEQNATAKWADFDVKGNTVLLGGGVTVTKMVPDPENPSKDKMQVGRGDRLRLDLTTGVHQFEAEPGTPPPPPSLSVLSKTGDKGAPVTAATAAEKARDCPPGRTCILAYPGQLKQKAIDTLKKKGPQTDAE